MCSVSQLLLSGVHLEQSKDEGVKEIRGQLIKLRLGHIVNPIFKKIKHVFRENFFYFHIFFHLF